MLRFEILLVIAAFMLQACSPVKHSPLEQNFGSTNVSIHSMASIAPGCDELPEKEIYMITGQSNAEGLGQVAHISANDFHRQVFSSHGFRFSYWNKGFHNAWQNGSVVFNGPNFGSEISIAARLQAMGKTDFYIYKSSSGGSALRNLGGTNEWRSRGAGGIYDETVRDFQNAQKQICNSGYKPVVKLLFWMQGESDSNVPSIANQYEANLFRLITELREDILSYGTPVVLGKIRSGADSLWTYAETVRAADDAVARRLPLVTTIETNDLSYYRVECNAQNPGYCNAHYDAQGMLDMGERVLASYFSGSTIGGTQPAAPAPTPVAQLAEGFYRIGNTDGIYYLNGQGGACVFTTWENFVRWSQYPTAAQVRSVPVFPALTMYGACQ